jgi:hypothetical protein
MQRFAIAIAAFLTSAVAYAGITAVPLPEPGILELLGIAGVVGAVVALRNRRRK